MFKKWFFGWHYAPEWLQDIFIKSDIIKLFGYTILWNEDGYNFRLIK